MIQNKDENVRTTLKFYDKMPADVEQVKIQLEAKKRLADLFKLITLKKECLCFNETTTLPSKLTVEENSAKKLNFVKKKKLVNCPKTQLENLVINNDLFKMYS